MAMTDLKTVIKGTIVPNTRAEIIHSQYPSENERKQAAAIYYINVHRCASWENLAQLVYGYSLGEAAIKVLKCNLPKIVGNKHSCVVCSMMHLL